ncbi:MAG: zinc-dependent metalloprotease family protein, partial [Bacteroidota bacterium]
NTDPYTNNDLNAILDENATNLRNVIGAANYDIGHVFGTEGGGLAGLGVVCGSAKEKGATGLSSPIGDFFDVVYVGHEIGHQFGAPHTYNKCQDFGVSSVAYEPGSGTTIMGYAGLCGSDNVSGSTDYFFHSGSYDIIIAESDACAVLQATGNSAPVVSISSPANATIPISTPFTLKGSATDADGHNLFYTWDQMDVGPSSPLGTPTGTAPLFRFRPPSSSPERTFPQITNVINNSSNITEVLPTTSRSINFRLVARDMQVGGGGVDYASYTMSSTDQAGPFLVEVPNTNVTWLVGATELVTWDVANTNAAPVNCSHVNILLSTDGGLTYPVTLASNVPNNGAANITVPDEAGTNNRVRVEAADNVFFDISNADFTIEQPVTPSFTMVPEMPEVSICGFSDAEYRFNLTALS